MVIVLGIVDTHVIVNCLLRGAIIGIARGRMEFSARALGNRSILADPRNPGVIKK